MMLIQYFTVTCIIKLSELAAGQEDRAGSKQKVAQAVHVGYRFAVGLDGPGITD